MLLRHHLLLRRRIALAKPRQAAAFLVVAVVASLFVQSEEAGEEHDLAGGAERVLARALHNRGGRPLEPRRGHLAGERALPDQFVEPAMIARAGAVAREFGRA